MALHQPLLTCRLVISIPFAQQIKSEVCVSAEPEKRPSALAGCHSQDSGVYVSSDVNSPECRYGSV